MANIDLARFRLKVREYRLLVNHNQSDLAAYLNLDYNELSNRLNGHKTTRLSHENVRGIVRALAEWRAITTAAQADELLDMMLCPRFDPADLQAQPLSKLSVTQPHNEKPPVNNPSYTVTAGDVISRHNLPQQLSSFIGRNKEIAELKKFLTQGKARLVTLIGSGGCGKTRLSLQVAAELLTCFQDGVWLVELAPLHNPTLIPQVIAQTLGITEQTGQSILETLIQHLRQRRILLVLDNCEHLVEECSRVIEKLLKQSTLLRVLATSRENLDITGEISYQVPSLSVPPLEEVVSIEKILDFEALQLFVERATTANSQFMLGPAETPALVQVCRRLDGIPLALELAAARTRVLTLQQVQSRLDDRFNLLTSGSRNALPRQQTLRAMVDWSYNLLSEGEQQLLNRVSVFAGSWNLAAAEAVCSPSSGQKKFEVLDGLTSLATKSMLVVDKQGSEARYQLLETIRQYGLEKLQAAGEEGVVRKRHLDYYAELVEKLEPNMIGLEQAQTLRNVDPELDNLRSAIEYGLKQQQFEPIFHLTVSLFWEIRGYHTEGYPYLAQALNLPGAVRVKRGKALFWAGHFLTHQGKLSQAIPYFEESLALSKALTDNDLVWHALLGMGDIFMDQENFAEAQHYYQEGLIMAEELDHHRKTTSLIHLSGALIKQAKYQEAHKSFEEGQSIALKAGNLWGAACVLRGQAHLAMLEEDYEAGHRYVDQAIPLAEQINLLPLKLDVLVYRTILFAIEDKFQEACNTLEESLDLGLDGDFGVAARAVPLATASLLSKVWLKKRQGQAGLAERIACLCGVTLKLQPGITKVSSLPFRTYFEQAKEVAQSELSEESFEEAFARGQSMSLEEAIAFIRQTLTGI